MSRDTNATIAVDFKSASNKTFSVSKQLLEAEKKQFEQVKVDDLMQFADPLPPSSPSSTSSSTSSATTTTGSETSSERDLRARSEASLAAAMNFDDEMVDFDDPSLLALLDGTSSTSTSSTSSLSTGSSSTSTSSSFSTSTPSTSTTTTTTTTSTTSSSPSESSNSTAQPPPTGGFVTGRLKPLTVSEGSMKKAQALMKSVEEDLEFGPITSDDSSISPNKRQRGNGDEEESSKKSKPNSPQSPPVSSSPLTSTSTSTSTTSTTPSTTSIDNEKGSQPSQHRRVGLSKNSPAPPSTSVSTSRASQPQSPTVSHSRSTIPQRGGKPLLKRGFNPPSRVSKSVNPENETS